MAGRTALLTLCRPAVLNALNTESWRQLEQLLAEVELGGDIDACIISGSERAFSAGADVAELDGRTLEGLVAHAERVRRILNSIENSGKPFVAAVNGLAVGGGAELALACHVRVAADGAWFSFPEVKLGLLPGAGGTQRLARIIGKGRAMELVLTGRRLSAVEAERWGLVNEVVQIAEMLPAAYRWAESLSGAHPAAVALAIEAVNAAYEVDLARGTRLETALLAVRFGMREKQGLIAKQERDQ